MRGKPIVRSLIPANPCRRRTTSLFASSHRESHHHHYFIARPSFASGSLEQLLRISINSVARVRKNYGCLLARSATASSACLASTPRSHAPFHRDIQTAQRHWPGIERAQRTLPPRSFAGAGSARVDEYAFGTGKSCRRNTRHKTSPSYLATDTRWLDQMAVSQHQRLAEAPRRAVCRGEGQWTMV